MIESVFVAGAEDFDGVFDLAREQSLNYQLNGFSPDGEAVALQAGYIDRLGAFEGALALRGPAHELHLASPNPDIARLALAHTLQAINAAKALDARIDGLQRDIRRLDSRVTAANSANGAVSPSIE